MWKLEDTKFYYQSWQRPFKHYDFILIRQEQRQITLNFYT